MSRQIARLALVALSTLRITRFVTSDFLGEWLLVGPAKRWAVRDVKAPEDSSDEHKALIEKTKRLALEEESTTARDELLHYGAKGPYASKRARLVKGLDCPYCVGFWIGLLVIVAELLTGGTPSSKDNRRAPLRALRPLWLLAASAASLNYVTGQVSSRMDG